MRKRDLLSLLTVCSFAASGCIFQAPPPLPGEDEFLAKGEAGAAGSDSAGTESVAGEGAEPSEDVSAGLMGFSRGDPPRVGMSSSEIVAYARAQGDPHDGSFELEAAVEGLAGSGGLIARLSTSRGEMRCRLLADEAPKTVANFVGLARGKRAFLEANEWQTGPYYDGTVLHRVIPGFMIQGGDRTGTGSGSPGYVIVDEASRLRRFDSSGLLAMANMGPTTGGSQFFVTLAPTPHLNGAHTIFGVCDDAAVTVAREIAATPRDGSDRPRTDVVLQRVIIEREVPGTPRESDEQPSSTPAASSPPASVSTEPAKPQPKPETTPVPGENPEATPNQNQAQAEASGSAAVTESASKATATETPSPEPELN